MIESRRFFKYSERVKSKMKKKLSGSSHRLEALAFLSKSPYHVYYCDEAANMNQCLGKFEFKFSTDGFVSFEVSLNFHIKAIE